MTVIAYVKGTIYADRLHIVSAYDSFRDKLKSKIYINEDQTIAFAATGAEIFEDSLPIIFTALTKFLELRSQIKSVTTTFRLLNEDAMNVVLRLGERNFILLTKDEAYALRDDNSLILHEDDIDAYGRDKFSFMTLYHGCINR